MIRCPSKTSEAVIVLRFSLVELSRRRAVLLRGGPRRKGRVESHVHLPLLSLHFGATRRYLGCVEIWLRGMTLAQSMDKKKK